MAFFPESIMPSRLKDESSDVKGNKFVVSAADVNKHDEEIRAIERVLGPIGPRFPVDFSGFATIGPAIAPANDAPMAMPDSVVIGIAERRSMDVLKNDVDPNGNDLSIVSVTQGFSGLVSINPDNTVAYSGALGFSGTDSFDYKISDGHGGMATATVLVMVSATPPANSSPVAVADSATTGKNRPVVIDVLANDSDVDLDPLSVTGVTTPAHGNAAINPDNTITYTPDQEFVGVDSFGYDVGDGRGGMASATVSVTVTANNPPEAMNDFASTNMETPVVIDVLANDMDFDGDALSITTVSVPSSGSAVDNGDGTITYTPITGFSGLDSFTYGISDGTDTDSATVNVSVTPCAPGSFGTDCCPPSTPGCMAATTMPCEDRVGNVFEALRLLFGQLAKIRDDMISVTSGVVVVKDDAVTGVDGIIPFPVAWITTLGTPLPDDSGDDEIAPSGMDSVGLADVGGLPDEGLVTIINDQSAFVIDSGRRVINVIGFTSLGSTSDPIFDVIDIVARSNDVPQLDTPEERVFGLGTNVEIMSYVGIDPPIPDGMNSHPPGTPGSIMNVERAVLGSTSTRHAPGDLVFKGRLSVQVMPMLYRIKDTSRNRRIDHVECMLRSNGRVDMRVRNKDVGAPDFDDDTSHAYAGYHAVLIKSIDPIPPLTCQEIV